MTKVYIGATSGSVDKLGVVIAKAFKDAKFPITLTIENLAPRNFSFPELGVPLLRNALSQSSDTRAVVTVNDFDLLQRAMSTVEQISDLNGYKVAISLQEGQAIKAETPKTEEPKQKDDSKGKKGNEAETKVKG